MEIFKSIKTLINSIVSKPEDKKVNPSTKTTNTNIELVAENKVATNEDTLTISNKNTSAKISLTDEQKKNLENKLQELHKLQENLNKIKNEQGFIGKSWNWIKNKINIGDSYNKAETQIKLEAELINYIINNKEIDENFKNKFKEVTSFEFTNENFEKFKNGELLKSEEKVNAYKQGQDASTDTVADIISGITSFGIYGLSLAAAPFTGGASMAVGVVVASITGATIKSGIKAIEAYSGNKKYTKEEFKKDLFTGGINGILAPITGGIGGAVYKTVGKALGLKVATKAIGQQASKQLVKSATKSTAQKAFSETLKRATAYTASSATSGATWGALNNGAINIYEQVQSGEEFDTNEVLNSMVEGAAVGAMTGVVTGAGAKGLKFAKNRGLKIFKPRKYNVKNTKTFNGNANKPIEHSSKTVDKTNANAKQEVKTVSNNMQKNTNPKVNEQKTISSSSTKATNVKVNEIKTTSNSTSKATNVKINEIKTSTSSLSNKPKKINITTVKNDNVIKIQTEYLNRIKASNSVQKLNQIEQEIKSLHFPKEFNIVKERLIGENTNKKQLIENFEHFAKVSTIAGSITKDRNNIEQKQTLSVNKYTSNPNFTKVDNSTKNETEQSIIEKINNGTIQKYTDLKEECKNTSTLAKTILSNEKLNKYLPELIEELKVLPKESLMYILKGMQESDILSIAKELKLTSEEIEKMTNRKLSYTTREVIDINNKNQNNINS